jgi:type IV pilus assembly protein PilE
MRCERARPPFPRGLGLIELLVGLAIAGVLAGLAYPAYQSALLKLRRAEALAIAGQWQLDQERYRGQQLRFATLGELGLPALSTSGRYQLADDTPGASSCTLRLTAQGSQAADASCRHLQLQINGQQTLWSSGPDARLGNNSEENRRCWAR